MPTYFVNSSNIKLSKLIKKKLANQITKIHNKVTGANKYFAQVIFNNTKKGNHFMGGKIVSKSCLLYTSPSPRDRTRTRMPSSA